jgi:two-component system, NarL family, nitrate/nitrite response regulator NarL
MQDNLSEREQDVARMLARGATNKEIARALGIEVVTVKRHVGNIFRKLGARNRTQAAIMLARRPAGGVSPLAERSR